MVSRIWISGSKYPNYLDIQISDLNHFSLGFPFRVNGPLIDVTHSSSVFIQFAEMDLSELNVDSDLDDNRAKANGFLSVVAPRSLSIFRF